MFPLTNKRTIALCVAGLIGLAGLLTLFRVNQSSVGMYANSTSKPGWVGVDRPIRSDEWLVRLPWLRAQAENNFADKILTAGSHDAAITYDLPTRSFQLILKPHLWPYLLFDFDRALSAEWWIIVLGGAVSIFLLLVVLGLGPAIALPLALIAGLSPGLHWWNVTATFTVVLYGCLGTTALILALRSRRKASRAGLALLGGWFFSCATVVLYPPIQIPVFGALGFLLVGELVSARKASRLTSALLAGTISFAATMGLTIWFVLMHRAALSAMSSTVYPGSRRVLSGGVNISSLFGTPFDLKSSGQIAGAVNGTNQSENSSAFIVMMPALLLLPIIFSGLRGIRERVTGVLLFSWVFVLMAWMLVSVPSIVGRLTLLNRVPPDRIKPTLAFLSVLALGIVFDRLSQIPKSTRLFSVSVFFFVTLYAGSRYTVNDVLLPPRAVWGWALLWFVPLALVFVGPRKIGLWLLVAISFFTSLAINPIHTTTAPISSNSITRAIKEIDPNRSKEWVTFSGPAQVRGAMVASGAQVLSAVSPYPDEEFWSRFDSGQELRSVWNRYAHVFFALAPEKVDITLQQADVVQILINPCEKSSPIRAGTFFVESTPDSIPCTEVVTKVQYLGSTWFVLEKTS